ncbi:MAG: gamma carbonic anhydrase family protein [Phycisphaerae bacterium]
MQWPAFDVAMQPVGQAFVSLRAVVTGDVTLGPEVSVWPHVVIRGDVAPIRIGARTNIQDGSILHCRPGCPLEIGADVVIGHVAVVHCARVGAGALIGIRAVVLDNAEVGDGAVIAAGAIVTPGTRIPPNVVAMGTPARPVRDVTAAERDYHAMALNNYLRLARVRLRAASSDRLTSSPRRRRKTARRTEVPRAACCNSVLRSGRR